MVRQTFPNQIPFTIPESEKKTVAVIKYAEESGTFVEENADLFKRYPQGAAFLIPHKSGFSFDAYKTMKDMGLKYNKRVDDYLKEVQTAADLQTYYSKKNEYEVSLTTKVTDFERSMARDEFQSWAKVFKAGRPLVQEELAEGGKKAIARIAAIDDLRKMLNDNTVTTRGSVQKSLKEMLDVYDSYKMQRQALENVSGTTNLVAFMKDSAIVKIRELSVKLEESYKQQVAINKTVGATTELRRYDILASLLADGGTGDGPKTTTQTYVTSASQTAKLLDTVASDLLGRKLTKAEKNKYTQLINAEQRKQPSRTTSGDGFSTTRGGVDEQQFITEKIAGTAEAKTNRTTDAYAVMMQELGGLQ